MNTVIQTRGLEKRFGRVRALNGLDLSVEAGEVHGFLGPNGAGKSTTIRVLLGLIRSSGGSATLFDRDPWRDAVELHRRIAYVPGDVSLWSNLSGGESIDLITRLRGGETDKQAYAARRAHLVEAFQFGAGREMANQLSRLVLDGIKTATSDLIWHIDANNKPLFVPDLRDRAAPVALIR